MRRAHSITTPRVLHSTFESKLPLIKGSRQFDAKLKPFSPEQYTAVLHTLLDHCMDL